VLVGREDGLDGGCVCGGLGNELEGFCEFKGGLKGLETVGLIGRDSVLVDGVVVGCVLVGAGVAVRVGLKGLEIVVLVGRDSVLGGGTCTLRGLVLAGIDVAGGGGLTALGIVVLAGRELVLEEVAVEIFTLGGLEEDLSVTVSTGVACFSAGAGVISVGF